MIKYRPYGNIELTEEGERIGRAVVRRHRIIETYLVTSLGMPWDQVHDEADRLEHAASEELVDRMDEVLGHPDADPHGDPIPRSSNTNHPEVVLIAHTTAGAKVRVARVSDSNPEILRFLAERGIAIGTRLEVLSGLSGMGLMTIGHEGTEIELSAPIAEAIHVAPAN